MSRDQLSLSLSVWIFRTADVCYKEVFQCLLFFKMNSREENRLKLSFTAKVITRHYSERFPSICGQKMKDFLKFCKLIKPDTRSDPLSQILQKCTAA